MMSSSFSKHCGPNWFQWTYSSLIRRQTKYIALGWKLKFQMLTWWFFPEVVASCGIANLKCSIPPDINTGLVFVFDIFCLPTRWETFLNLARTSHWSGVQECKRSLLLGVWRGFTGRRFHSLPHYKQVDTGGRWQKLRKLITYSPRHRTDGLQTIILIYLDISYRNFHNTHRSSQLNFLPKI